MSEVVYCGRCKLVAGYGYPYLGPDGLETLCFYCTRKIIFKRKSTLVDTAVLEALEQKGQDDSSRPVNTSKT